MSLSTSCTMRKGDQPRPARSTSLLCSSLPWCSHAGHFLHCKVLRRSLTCHPTSPAAQRPGAPSISVVNHQGVLRLRRASEMPAVPSLKKCTSFRQRKALPSGSKSEHKNAERLGHAGSQHSSGVLPRSPVPFLALRREAWLRMLKSKNHASLAHSHLHVRAFADIGLAPNWMTTTILRMTWTAEL